MVASWKGDAEPTFEEAVDLARELNDTAATLTKAAAFIGKLSGRLMTISKDLKKRPARKPRKSR